MYVPKYLRTYKPAHARSNISCRLSESYIHCLPLHSECLYQAPSSKLQSLERFSQKEFSKTSSTQRPRGTPPLEL